MAVTLTVGGNARIDYTRHGSVKVRTTADGQQGVLDFTLVDPPTIPAVEDAATLVDGATTLYDGFIRSVMLRQIRDTVYVEVSCQDDAVAVGLPTAAAFGLSDTPDEVTTYGFRELTLRTDSISGSIKTTGVAVIDQPGLAPGENFNVTSVNYGLTAQEFTIQQIEVTYTKETAPVYAITFGDPLVRLSQVVRNIPDGSITSTMIGEHAIKTEHLTAYAVQTVSNDGASVVIDENGITITDGYLNFPFPGGENAVQNSGFELGAFVAALTNHVWTTTANFNDTDVRAVTNITVSDGLALTGSTY